MPLCIEKLGAISIAYDESSPHFKTSILDLEREIIERRISRQFFRAAGRCVQNKIYSILNDYSFMRMGAAKNASGVLEGTVSPEAIWTKFKTQMVNNIALENIISEMKRIGQIDLLPRHNEITKATSLPNAVVNLITQYDSLVEHIILFSDSILDGNELRERIKLKNKSVVRTEESHRNDEIDPTDYEHDPIASLFVISSTLALWSGKPELSMKLDNLLFTSSDYFKLVYLNMSTHLDDMLYFYLNSNATADQKYIVLHNFNNSLFVPGGIQDKHVVEMMDKKFTNLKGISLFRCIEITDISLKAISDAKLGHLTFLSLSYSSITDAGLQELCSHSNIRKSLRHLSVEGTRVGSEGVRAVASSLHNLKNLNIKRLLIDDNDIATIAESDAMSNLHCLYFLNGIITVVALRAIFASPQMKNLVRIESSVELPDDLRAYIKETFHFKKLRHFNEEILEHFFHQISLLQEHVQKLQTKTMKINRDINEDFQNLSRSHRLLQSKINLLPLKEN